MPKYTVTMYYSGFFTREVEADSENEAIDIIDKTQDIDFNEVASNLEPMPELHHADLS